LAPDLELAFLGLRLGFFLGSLPLAWSRLPLAKYFGLLRVRNPLFRDKLDMLVRLMLQGIIPLQPIQIERALLNAAVILSYIR